MLSGARRGNSRLNGNYHGEGSITVTFEINGQNVSINDHDLKPGEAPIDRNANRNFSIDPYHYEISGTGSYVEDRRRDRTYLKYRIIRHSIKNDRTTAAFRLNHGSQYTNGRVD